MAQAEPTERADVNTASFPPVEPTSNIGIESYRKIAEKNAPPNPGADSKGQKNGFFGGLFGRKK